MIVMGLSLLSILNVLAPAASQSLQYSKYDGNRLYELCSGDGSELPSDAQKAVDDVVCVTYIVGVIDGVKVMSASRNSAGPFCLPNSISTYQLRDVVKSYLRQNPQLRHLGATALIWNAIRISFPCSSERG